MQYKLVVFILIFSIIQQTKSQYPKKFRDITAQDFSIVNNYETNENIILQEKCVYYFDEWNNELRLINDIERRILIASNENLNNYKYLRIHYYGHKNFEQIGNVQVFVYTIEKGVVKETRIKSKHKKVLKLDDENYFFVVEIPSLKAGSIIEYRYTIASLNMVIPRTWYFQHKERCLYSSFDFFIPNFYGYNLKLNDSLNVRTKINKDIYTNINFYFRYNDPIPGGLTYRNRSFSTNINLSLQSTLYSFEMTNIEPIDSVDYVDNIDNYRKKIEAKLTYINNKTGLVRWYDILAFDEITKNIYKACLDNYPVMDYQPNSFTTYSAGFVVYRVKDWQGFDIQMMREKYWGLQLMKFANLKPIVDSIVENKKTDFDKIEAIYDYLIKNYKWNGKYDLFMSDNLEKIVKNKSGNSTDLNILLLRMLQIAEFNAEPVVVKTLDKGKLDEDWASPMQFNSTIVAIEIDNNYYFVDASNHQGKWYWLNPDVINGTGRIVSKTNGRMVDIRPNTNNVMVRKVMVEQKNSNFFCTFQQKNVGLLAKKIKNDDYAYNLANSFVDIANFSIHSIEKNSDTLYKFSCSFETSDFVEDNKFFPFILIDEIDFLKYKNRQIPLYIGFPQKYIYQIVLKPKDFISISNENKQIKGDGLYYSFKTIEISDNLTLEIVIDFQKYYYDYDQLDQIEDLAYEMMRLYDFYYTLKK